MAAQYGTAEDAKAMLEKAVAAVKENKAKALDMFNKGDGDKRDHLLVAAPWLRQAAREDHLLHEGRRSDLRSRLLQGVKAWP